MQLSVSLKDDGMFKQVVDKIVTLEGNIHFCNVLYVLAGLKPVTRFLLTKVSLEEARTFLESTGLKMLVSDIATFENDKIKYMVYISGNEDSARDALRAEMDGDHETLGRLLGYPECCVKSFSQNYELARRLFDDYTLIALENSYTQGFPFYMNVSLRYFDASFLNHFPCSFNCSSSLELAKQFAECIKRCTPHLYDQMITKLATAVIYSNDTGVHAFKDVSFTQEGFHYDGVRLTSPNEFHELLKKGNNIKVLDKHHFIIYNDQEKVKEVNDELIGVLQFNTA
ncbi:DUF483 domain-containing protein [Thermoproteota archaeon]